MQMTVETAFVVLGALFLVGLAADELGRRTKLPRVTLLLLCGILVGKSGLALIPDALISAYNILSVLALSMVAFLLGGTLKWDTLVTQGRAILFVSSAVAVLTLCVTTTGLWAIGIPLEAALMLGAIATATDPAATREAIRQSGKETRFTSLLNGIVAIDDAWGMMLFAGAVVAARALGDATLDVALLVDAVWEIGGAVLLGLAIGLPGAFLTGRLQPGEPTQTEALGVVFLTTGLALWLDVSFLLAGMTVGAVIVNRARHHDRAFHEIEHVQWPFLTMFFLLAGASLDLQALLLLGVAGVAYSVLRVFSRILGGQVGGRLAGLPRAQARWTGVALLPQAGVAVGMALVAAQEFPDSAALILTLTIGTTVVFELVGPVCTLWAIRRVDALSNDPKV